MDATWNSCQDAIAKKKKLENINALMLKIPIPLKTDEYLPLFSAKPL